jgi:hypothetical protein
MGHVSERLREGRWRASIGAANDIGLRRNLVAVDKDLAPPRLFLMCVSWMSQ